jgi:hypothetical protein
LQYLSEKTSAQKAAPRQNRGAGVNKKIYCLFFPHLCKALAAVYRAVFTRFKGDLCFFAAAGANCGVHFTLRLCGILARIAAGFASLGFVHETLGCVKFLFPGSEYKFSAAFLADESLVFVHLIYLALWIKDICP